MVLQFEKAQCPKCGGTGRIYTKWEMGLTKNKPSVQICVDCLKAGRLDNYEEKKC